MDKRSLDDAVDSNHRSPTRLIRNLIAALFPTDVLTKSNACGGVTKHQALDKDVTAACTSKCFNCTLSLCNNDYLHTEFVHQRERNKKNRLD